MADISLDSFKLAVVLIPGFLSARIRDFFRPPRTRTAFDQLMEAVAFSVANAVLYFFALRPLVLLLGLLSGDASLELLSGLGLSSVLLGLASGLVVGKDIHYRLARRLNLTARTGRADVWQDVFEDIRGNWLLVHLDDGQRVLGWARYYSDEGRNPSLFLRQASWVAEDGSTTPVDGEGLLVTERARVKYVEFVGMGDESDESSENT